MSLLFETDNQNSSVQSPVSSKVIGVNINGNDTDIVINNFRDRIFIVLSQHKKLGSLIAVNKETAQIVNGCSGELYRIRTLLGQDETAFHIAARYLTEETKITKPVLYSFCMKDCSIHTLKVIKEIIVNAKMW